MHRNIQSNEVSRSESSILTKQEINPVECVDTKKNKDLDFAYKTDILPNLAFNLVDTK